MTELSPFGRALEPPERIPLRVVCLDEAPEPFGVIQKALSRIAL
jgi:hypothetical protein